MTVLFDITDMNVDEYLEGIVDTQKCLVDPYLIMSKDTFRLFKLLSKHYDKDNNTWEYDGGLMNTPPFFGVAIDNGLTFGEVIIK